MSRSASSLGITLSTTIPTDAQIPYTAPSIPIFISLSTYLVLLALPTLLSNTHPIRVDSPQPQPENDEKSVANTAPNVPNETQSQSYTLNAALTLILPLFLGALFGPSVTSSSILSTSTQRTLMDIGYMGLLLLIFEAGVSLDAASLKLMRNNAGLSTLAALTGVLVPIALSMGLGMGAYGYTGLQAFASGAALCSTSLGTTLALLASSSSGVDLRRTRVGCVLVSAALLDDIIGLVIAGIIPGLAQSESGIRWPIVVRPILVSLAFGFGTPVAAMWLRWLIRFPWKDAWATSRTTFDCRCRRPSSFRHTTSPTRRRSGSGPRPQFLFILIILTLMGFVAGTSYAGTSELFGAYLAGAFIGYVFEEGAGPRAEPQDGLSVSNHCQDTTGSKPETDGSSGNPTHAAFVVYLQPILTHLLAPLFFASIGAALPIKAMFTTHPDAVQIVFTVDSNNTSVIEIVNGRASHQVIWRGLVYAVLMVLGKMVVGIWMLIWPDPRRKARLAVGSPRRASSPPNVIAPVQWVTNLKSVFKLLPPSQNREDLPRTLPRIQEEEDIAMNETISNEPSRVRSALLLGLAMVARGEIALIVAQLARPLLVVSTTSSSTSTTTYAVTTGTETAISMVTTIPVPDEEPFAIVIWAILVSTVGGALGVGVLITSWEKKDQEEAGRKYREAEQKGRAGDCGSSLKPTGRGDK
ncbi:Sodium/hydrogen exchanger family-domain-containing protein [Pholiota molesta]|nr:Sodium/hydrogen exchanger family-domain-containing protein [Pholiota molesta]